MEDDPSRTKSLASIGFSTKSLMDDEERKETPRHPQDEEGNIFDINCLESENNYIPKDVISFVVICEQHKKIALQLIMNYFYFPSVQFENNAHSVFEMSRSVMEMFTRSNLDGMF